MIDFTKNFIVNKLSPLFLGFYFVAIFLLFLAELGVFGLQNYLRATNQVLVLLVLLILPVVVIGASRFVHSLTVKISGQELHLELSELRQDMNNEVSRVETNLGGQISNAEQALWPLLAGKDIQSVTRLRNKQLVIGSKLDISHLFFGYLLALSIEKLIPGVICEVRFPNGGSMKNFADLQNRWIDLYVDATGTCCQYFNIDHHGKSDEQIQEELNQYGDLLDLKWLSPLGASEDYCLVMTKKKADKYNIQSITDLKILGPQLTLSADPEFLNRNDCYLGLKKYGIEFNKVRPCRITERYESMANDEADVFVGYETDPELYTGQVIRLADPDEFFPRYLAIPVANKQALAAIPGLEQALNKLDRIITTQDLVQAVSKLSRYGKNVSVAKGLAEEYVKVM